MTGSYDYRLVTLSVVMAVCAAYVALDLAGRTTASRGPVRHVWLAGGAVAMGLGIWSMHYIGMLAFLLPVPVFYDWPTVLVSLFAAIFASGVALFVVSRRRRHALHRHGCRQVHSLDDGTRSVSCCACLATRHRRDQFRNPVGTRPRLYQLVGRSAFLRSDHRAEGKRTPPPRVGEGGRRTQEVGRPAAGFD